MTDKAHTTQLDDDLLRSWRLRLMANRRSRYTVRNYLQAGQDLKAFMERQGCSMAVAAIKRSTVEAYQVDCMDRGLGEATICNRHKGLKQLFAFLVDDEEIDVSPMARMPVPAVTEPDVPVLSDADVAALLGVCSGSSFTQRRNLALLTLMLDSGLRLQEVTDLSLESLATMEDGVISVLGKGSKWRDVAIGHGTVAALDRYLRIRRRHRYASSTDQLWLGQQGAITARSVGEIVAVTGRRAVLGAIHPHQLRHTWASNMKEAGAQHDELKALGGWSTDVMLQRYGRATLKRRAVASGRRLSVVDRLARK